MKTILSGRARSQARTPNDLSGRVALLHRLFRSLLFVLDPRVPGPSKDSNEDAQRVRTSDSEVEDGNGNQNGQNLLNVRCRQHNNEYDQCNRCGRIR